jgi:hypothetical protein
MMTNNQIITLLKSVINRHVPDFISETVYLNNDRLVAYDLYNYISIPYKSGGITACLRINDLEDAFKKIKRPQFSAGKDFQVHITGASNQLTLYGYNPELYLKIPLDRQISFTQFAAWTSKEIGYLKKALPFARKERWNKDEWGMDEWNKYKSDEDRLNKLAMTGVFVGTDIVARDLYYMYRQPVSPAIEPSFIIPAKVVKLITGLPKTTWKLFYGEKQQDRTKEKREILCAGHVYLISKEGIIVGFIPVNAPYPNYQADIPEGESLITIKASSGILKMEIAKAVLCSAPYTYLVIFKINTTLQVCASDVNRGIEYRNLAWASCRFTKPGHHNEFTIGFDGEYLYSILDQIDGQVTIKLWTPTSLVSINDRYFISPTRLQANC